ncbi:MULTISPECIES: DUF882 domain-containing protein [Rhodomicrobium]|uniref:DUF882 domain-containing protein n=1 Tax=Rhodomicrobium TaxID=1068 RepID=UPI001FD9D16E|nr:MULTISPECIES: DUF882 domain-containing protein [Rhodomicrobium]
MGKLPIGLGLRRHAVAAFALLTSTLVAALTTGASAEDREIAFYNIHTKENISVVYKRDGKFVPEALQKLNSFMRDWRRNITIKMDPELIDLIWEIHQELGSKKPVSLICGHRSEATNEGLRRTRGGQAKHSMHILGKAADIQFPDVSAKQLRNSALIRERGGVGYYPTSAIPFVHVDTGRVRHWPRIPRQELALLFPSGKSQHVPADGRPITKRDFQIALANLQERGGELPIGVQRVMNGGKLPQRPILASYAPPVPAAAPAPLTVAAVAPAGEPKKPEMVFASLTPSFGGLGGKPAPREEPRTVLQARTQQTAARADEDFSREFLRGAPGETASAPSNLVPEDQMAAAPDYDDDHPDELDYQPFPILPFMSDTPIASMDMTTGEASAELTLAKVHVMFTESREMLHAQFQPGLQYAQMYWAQRFRGTAVNTELRRVARDDGPAEPVKTAQNNTQQSARK